MYGNIFILFYFHFTAKNVILKKYKYLQFFNYIKHFLPALPVYTNSNFTCIKLPMDVDPLTIDSLDPLLVTCLNCKYVDSETTKRK